MSGKNDKKINIYRQNNRIVLYKMNHPKCVSDFIECIKYGLSNGYNDFVIDEQMQTVFPNACVPIAGIIDYYREIKKISFSYEFRQESYLQKCGFDNPINHSAEEIKAIANPFDKLFIYNASSQVAAITQAYIDTLSQTIECEKGIIDGMIWCINEVMDNVLIHSGENHGFVMAQVHKNNHNIVICVYDSGMGIYNSLKNSDHHPKKESDAISLAIQEGIGNGKGQGNGLYGLKRIIELNKGRLTITSGQTSSIMETTGNIKIFEKLPYIDDIKRTTTVDFQINLNVAVDIKKAFSNIGGFDGFDIRIDNMLQDDDYIRYDVFDNCLGTATRESGFHLRTDVLNIIKRNENSVIVDFSKVSTVSSSFIDEFIAKLIIQLGVVKFSQIVRLFGMNENIQYLCERSVYMRINHMWSNKDKTIESFDKLFDK